MNTEQIDLIIQNIEKAFEDGRVEDAVKILTDLRPADRADAFTYLDEEEQEKLLGLLDIPLTADLLEELDDSEAVDVAKRLPTNLLADILDEMEPDEAADVLGDLSPEQAAEALAEMEEAEDVLPLLGHPDETAGGLMTTSYIGVRPKTTVRQSIDFLRQLSPDEETPYYLYVVEAQNRLVGIVSLRALIIADPEDTVDTIMDPDVIYATTDADQEDAARQMAHYDLAALPVVDADLRLQGVITHDDLVDVIDLEATEDMFRLANVSDAELTISSPVLTSVRKRLPWMYLNTLTALFAAWVISQFEPIFSQVAVLAVFLGVVAGMGGNAATQSLTLVVRGIALGEISLRGSGKALLREAGTGLIQGLAVGALVGLAVFAWKGNFYLGLIIFLALLADIVIAAIIGTLVPLILKALRLDPALASGVLVTAVTDSAGFAIFLGLAVIFLPYLR
jgi:magnesium transporter